ncbi:MAG: sec-independent protein translocase protein TatA [Eubacteriales bacterium]|nr:sec-independent protein translocase protein TatA [Eubacteriales bacterium]MDN5364137.1 sec-independent protein translocase protein TatA [Eubacteriales bacterium]
MSFFGLGTQELLLILVIALIIFGPKKIPELARSLAKGINEFRRASREVEKEISEAVNVGEETAGKNS